MTFGIAPKDPELKGTVLDTVRSNWFLTCSLRKAIARSKLILFSLSIFRCKEFCQNLACSNCLSFFASSVLSEVSVKTFALTSFLRESISTSFASESDSLSFSFSFSTEITSPGLWPTLVGRDCCTGSLAFSSKCTLSCTFFRKASVPSTTTPFSSFPSGLPTAWAVGSPSSLTSGSGSGSTPAPPPSPVPTDSCSSLAWLSRRFSRVAIVALAIFL